MKLSPMTASGLGLTRNEAGRCFPHAEDAASLEELRGELADILTGAQWEQPWRLYDLDELTTVQLEHLVERGLMTPSFAEGTGEGRGFAVYGDALASLEINGADHLRVLGFRAGDQLESLWSLLNVIDDRIETSVSYAFDPHLGYLTSQPKQSGSGMRAYATVVVPALMLTGRLAGVAVELAAQGLALIPLWNGAGGVIQVSNLGSQGKPETEIIQQISDICAGIVEKEKSVRKVLARENPVQSRDQIGRALGTAQQAWSVSFFEAANIVSAIQVGADLGLVDSPGLAAEPAFALMSRLQPAHVVVDYMDARTGCLESPEIDQERARALRERFADTRVLS